MLNLQYKVISTMPTIGNVQLLVVKYIGILNFEL